MTDALLITYIFNFLVYIVGILLVYLGIYSICHRKVTFVPGGRVSTISRHEWYRLTKNDYPTSTGFGAVLIGIVYTLIGIGLVVAMFFYSR